MYNYICRFFSHTIISGKSIEDNISLREFDADMLSVAR